MQEAGKTRLVSKFKNTCHSCFSAVDIPLLSDYSYGELLFQTTDGRDFYIASLIGNMAFDFIVDTLESDPILRNKKIDPQVVLGLIADKPDGKDVTMGYPICPVCKRTQRHVNSNIKTGEMEVPFATWSDFGRLANEDMITKMREVVAGMA